MKHAATLLLALGAIALTGCNQDGSSPEGQTNLGNDWVTGDTPSQVTDPSPSPSATPTPTTAFYTGPAEVEKYVTKFIADARIQGRDVTPEFSNPKLEIRIASLDSYGSSTIGLCETSSSRRRVTFDPDFWNTASETQRELLAHHELGHCTLYRAHRNDTLATGKYASIMYPIIMTSATYSANYDYYQNELFTYGVSNLAAAGEEVEVSRTADTVHICQ